VRVVFTHRASGASFASCRRLRPGHVGLAVVLGETQGSRPHKISFGEGLLARYHASRSDELPAIVEVDVPALDGPRMKTTGDRCSRSVAK
jgi:hypothetical protein